MRKLILIVILILLVVITLISCTYWSYEFENDIEIDSVEEAMNWVYENVEYYTDIFLLER